MPKPHVWRESHQESGHRWSDMTGTGVERLNSKSHPIENVFQQSRRLKAAVIAVTAGRRLPNRGRVGPDRNRVGVDRGNNFFFGACFSVSTAFPGAVGPGSSYPVRAQSLRGDPRLE